MKPTLLLTLCATAVLAGNVTIAWDDPNPPGEVTHWWFIWGPSTNLWLHGQLITNIPPTNQVTVTNVQPGKWVGGILACSPDAERVWEYSPFSNIIEFEIEPPDLLPPINVREIKE